MIGLRVTFTANISEPLIEEWLYTTLPLNIFTQRNFFAAFIRYKLNFILKTRNTFCGTWYLPHSRVHKSMAEPCSNFGDSAITKGQIAYFSLRMRDTPIFLLPVKIWRYPRVPRPRFPIRWRNFGDSAKRKGQIAYFSLRMRERAIFLLPVENLTSPSCSPTPISYMMQEVWRFGNKYGPNCIFFIAHALNAYISTSGQKSDVTIMFADPDFL